ncbi:DeoR/GlpR family DNA-binding transcription regulator [Luteipulveratus mongoliensis]|uniref:Alkaline phosphatase n=1 Tax=Luteipulveratus mongoliensis TaxID=571913 RepID=A0A0K1JEF4_9MICO|nr:DeoR/GlpR family DNA-binding transcription regulator [Luteipulveratus mongoliensis]AKU14978.1 alkaline phosphatase [Luteipulveratus mongoliensis]
MATTTRDREPRWTALLQLLAERGRLTVTEASQELDVSPATIRRDFVSLAGQQLATRTHGAIVATSVTYSLPARYRSTSGDSSRNALAERVAQLIPSGTVVGLNGGRTTTAVARALASEPEESTDPARPPRLSVVTNALNIASELALRPSIRCLVLGGVARPGSYEMTGDLPVSALRRLWLDTLVLGVDGLSAAGGATCGHDEEAAVNAAMAARAARIIVVGTGDKVGRTRMAQICPASAVTTLITDAEAPAEELDALRDIDVDVQVL